jgi:tetratricopeptide (TPR) repeat protein
MAKTRRSSSKPSLGRERAGKQDAGRAAKAAPAIATSRRQITLCVVAALVALTAAVYFPVTTHDFVLLDDPFYFTRNPHLDGHLGLDDVRTAFAEPYLANWIPLTHLSIAVGDALHGAEPGAVIASNVALHALAGILLFLALARMTRQPGPSAFVAAVFLVHPLHVESVAWASSRKDVLAGVFWMATLYAYARYSERPGVARYALVAAGLVLALLSKPTALTLPFVLLLLDVWPLQRIGLEPGPWRNASRLGLEKVPLLALVLVFSVVTFAAQRGAGAVTTMEVPLAYRLGNIFLSYTAYLVDGVWPVGLAPFYPYPVHGLESSEVAASVALVSFVTAVCVWLARRQPALLVGWLWFLGTHVPTIGLVQVGLHARADRYMYLPLVGLALTVTWGGLALLELRPGFRRVAPALACASVLALAWTAHLQVRRWNDTVTLFEHAAAVTENNYFAHQMVGNALRMRGELERSERELREAVRINPQSNGARTDLAALLCDAGRTADARAELDRARQHGADAANFHALVGLVAEREGRTADAMAGYRKALEREPGHPEAANNLAWQLATSPDRTLRNPEEAIQLALRVVARDPRNPLVLDTLAAAYAAAGRSSEAVRTQSRALEALGANAPPAQRAEFQRRLDEYRAGSGAGS